MGRREALLYDFEMKIVLFPPAKLRALRAKNVLMCQRALRAYVFACPAYFCAHVPTCFCVLTYSRAKVPCVVTCLRTNVPCVLRCRVPTCFLCSRVRVSCVLTCSRANVPCVLACSPANVP